jgi:TetR/AcrR family transcriptional regulator
MTPSSDLPASVTGDSEEDASVSSPLPDEAIVPGASRQPPTLPTRKRPRPGERRVQILETLATMLQEPGAERVTTAALAAKLDVSEAALYRHFASKAQMFEGLIEFIEQSVFTLVNQIVEREADAGVQVQRVLGVLLQFGEKNPGMTRVMVGDALVFENDRLTARMNQFFERIESQLRQSLRQRAEVAGSTTPTVDANAQASVLTAFAIGRLQRFARSGFKKSPTEHLDVALRLFAA